LYAQPTTCDLPSLLDSCPKILSNLLHRLLLRVPLPLVLLLSLLMPEELLLLFGGELKGPLLR
jgi:hypothetical protein